jgi:hypothetical protein
MNVCNRVTMLHQNIYLTLKKKNSSLTYYCDKINFKIYSTVTFQVHENNQLKFDVLSKGFA